jgi:hypothetical protein
LEVIEQNYDYDLLSPETLIKKNIGRSVRIARRSRETGETLEWSQGVILSNNGGLILQMADGSLESLGSNLNFHLVFDEIPEDLRTTPTLSLLLKAPPASAADDNNKPVEITYLTTGLGWQSDYVLQLDAAETSASLDSWITLDNQSGAHYQDCTLQLLAGDINIQQAQPDIMMERVMLRAQTDSAIAEQELHGYHLYTVPHKTTLKDNQSKQIKLFSASEIKVNKILQDRTYVDIRALNPQKSKPDQLLRFENAAPALGLPMPKGTIRVYANDEQGNKQFIGEDAIPHTAVSDELEIKLGKSFDVTIERKTTRVNRLSQKQLQLEREIVINNGSNKVQDIQVGEIMPSQSWKIQHASLQYKVLSPSEAGFDVSIPPLDTITLHYEIEIIYP